MVPKRINSKPAPSSVSLSALFKDMRSLGTRFYVNVPLLSTLYQPFVIHDMKSLMEGEQFINCRQIPCQEHQQQQQPAPTLAPGLTG